MLTTDVVVSLQQDLLHTLLCDLSVHPVVNLWGNPPPRLEAGTHCSRSSHKNDLFFVLTEVPPQKNRNPEGHTCII